MGKMNQNLTVKLTKPGIYGYKYLLHYGVRMVGAKISHSITSLAVRVAGSRPTFLLVGTNP
jgi:hypothetical protein